MMTPQTHALVFLDGHAPIRPRLPQDLGATAESIAAAKAARDRERAAFTAATGLELDEDGRIGILLGNAMWAAVHGLRR